MSFSEWLFSDVERPESAHGRGDKTNHPWWQVMCLTGVDYFSTLGYQSGIAFLAAGVLSPVATLVLVLLTLFAALPVYNRVAAASPYGQGSIAMLEKLFPGWTGKVFVLVLLGFATTDFIITMTLSAADAAAHFIHNPFTPHALQNQMGVTLVLLAILGAIFLRGFKEAIHIAVVLVGVYLTLNLIVSVAGMFHVLEHPHVLLDWKRALFTQHGSLLSIIGLSCLLFPRLALGLSGFETGVAMMPLIECDNNLDLRIRNTRRLLASAAVIMSFFLMATSFITTLLIPAVDFKEGGPANGRAVAYLAHQYLGGAFGSFYDISTILILAFAGASAMAGLLNLIPRYLPGFGMAPEWARASRPLVLVFVSVAFMVTRLFHADVDAQGGAYATGVLVLITSASCAVTIAARTVITRAVLGFVSLIFIYTTLVNIYERPEGLKISCIFIFTMIFMSLVSRAFRSTELRITGVELDSEAQALVAESAHKTIRLIAWKPHSSSGKDRDQARADLVQLHGLSPDAAIYFVEVERGDTSDFTEYLLVQGIHEGTNRILHARSAAIANSIAALLIYLKQATGCIPHVYFHWTDVNPVINIARYIFLGEGDTAPLTHEVLRRAIKDPAQRPVVHVS
ncbi:MAG TPA: amino acid transporter [Acidobacteriaceae bacterium]|nr:amino acid transporter [Acidobacteriaceae bacterium]